MLTRAASQLFIPLDKVLRCELAHDKRNVVFRIVRMADNREGSERAHEYEAEADERADEIVQKISSVLRYHAPQRTPSQRS